MRDAQFAPVLLAIERKIHALDRAAAGANIALTDSPVRSALIKAMKRKRGESPAIPSESARDRLLAGLIADLETMHAHGIRAYVPGAPGEAVKPLPGRLPTAKWCDALATIENSIRIRTGGPGSRGYLDYLVEFLLEVERRTSINPGTQSVPPGPKSSTGTWIRRRNLASNARS